MSDLYVLYIYATQKRDVPKFGLINMDRNSFIDDAKTFFLPITKVDVVCK